MPAPLGQFYSGGYTPTVNNRKDTTLRDTLIAALVPELIQRTTRGVGTFFDDQPNGVGVADTGEITPDFLSAFFGPSGGEALQEDLTRARIEEALAGTEYQRAKTADLQKDPLVGLGLGLDDPTQTSSTQPIPQTQAGLGGIAGDAGLQIMKALENQTLPQKLLTGGLNLKDKVVEAVKPQEEPNPQTPLETHRKTINPAQQVMAAPDLLTPILELFKKANPQAGPSKSLGGSGLLG